MVQVTKHIRVRSAGSTGESAADLAAFTPSFLWLLRDFYLGVAPPMQRTASNSIHQGCALIFVAEQSRQSSASVQRDRCVIA